MRHSLRPFATVAALQSSLGDLAEWDFIRVPVESVFPYYIPVPEPPLVVALEDSDKVDITEGVRIEKVQLKRHTAFGSPFQLYIGTAVHSDTLVWRVVRNRYLNRVFSYVHVFHECPQCGHTDVLEMAEPIELGATVLMDGPGFLCPNCQEVMSDYNYSFIDEFDALGEECCDYCGKPYEEFGDLGCGRCDRRHPDWGIV